MGGRAWSEDDKAFLRDNAATMSNREMATLLDRTESSVQLYVNRMGIKGENGRKPRRHEDYARKHVWKPGDLVGRLTVDEVVVREASGGRRTFVRCTCVCGNTVERSATDLGVRDNHSCGCGKANPKHGLTGTPIFAHWLKMRDRCNNPKHESYPEYGGRGIGICPEWADPAVFAEWAFANGFEPDKTIDRQDNDRGYEPDNCRWSTPLEQANNRRNNRHLTIDGETKTVAQWARDPRAAVCLGTIRSRVSNGWGDEEAVLTPKTK